METIELICINCPMGCAMTVEREGDTVVSVTGNTCPRGDIYARKEVTDPTRIVTSTVKVEGGIHPRVSVKTERDIPKGKIFACMEAINSVMIKAPVHIGDIVVENVAGTGVNIIATRSI